VRGGGSGWHSQSEGFNFVLRIMRSHKTVLHKEQND
jgi:hypothetical protein